MKKKERKKKRILYPHCQWYRIVPSPNLFTKTGERNKFACISLPICLNVWWTIISTERKKIKIFLKQTLQKLQNCVTHISSEALCYTFDISFWDWNPLWTGVLCKKKLGVIFWFNFCVNFLSFSFLWLRFELWKYQIVLNNKLDGVGSVDNRPSAD